MQLTAVFETWHIGDGNYPPLHKDMLVRLSFEIEPDYMADCKDGLAESLEHVADATYNFAARVIREYGAEEDPDRLIVLETGRFRFYVCGDVTRHYKRGQMISGRGTLVLDHYLSVQFLGKYQNPPNIFYSLRVNTIRKIRIPEQLIVRGDHWTAYPTRVTSTESGEPLIEMHETEDEAFTAYLVEFSDEGIDLNAPIPGTFAS